MTEDAKNNFSIYEGITIPVLNGSYATAGISVIFMQPERRRFHYLKERHLDTLKKIASEYHIEVFKSKADLCFFLEPLFETLNDTKQKVIEHLLTGAPLREIKDRHQISQRYAEKVLLNLKREFGNITTNELIYILGMMNMRAMLENNFSDLANKPGPALEPVKPNLRRC